MCYVIIEGTLWLALSHVRAAKGPKKGLPFCFEIDDRIAESPIRAWYAPKAQNGVSDSIADIKKVEGFTPKGFIPEGVET